MKKRVTFIVKTFERPNCLNRLIYSIKLMYPDIRIIVADDSSNPCKLTGVDHLHMPYDSGVSAGRNLALSKVDTEFVVTLDDDFVFDHRTRLEKWLTILDETNLHMIGGNVDGHPEYHASLHIVDGALVFSKTPSGVLDNFILWNIVLQFWMSRTDKVKEIGGWDHDFKTVDHMIFFARSIGKLNIGHTPTVSVGHRPIKDTNYYNHRNCRMQQYLRLMMDKLQINRVIDINGRTLYTYDGNAIQ